jgi:hypothetical protein
LKILAAACAALVLVVAVGASTEAANTTSRLAAGDQLVYEITVELQQHHTTEGSKPHDTELGSSLQGTETFAISSVGADGTAIANVASSFQGTDKGQPFESHTTTSAKVMPDGRLFLKDQLGLGISEAIIFANNSIAEISQHPLQIGGGWTSPLNSPEVRLTVARKVTGVKTYQGFNAYEVQTIGTGDLLKTTDGKPATGTVAVSGTSYYDEADHLLIGEALRTLTVVELPGAKAGHDDYSATMDMVLNSWSHATPAPVESSAPESSPFEGTPEPEATTPAPVPSMLGATPYPTVTPRLGQ